MSLSLLRSWLITDPLFILATVMMGSLSLAASLVDPSGRRQHALSRAWARMLLAIARVKVTIEGLERINPAASYVFVANHSSYMDTPVILAHIPVQFRFMAKQGLFRIPFLGTHLKRAGHLAVVRGDARASVRSANEAARLIRERGISVLLFPEGGRTPQGLREFKEGAAFIAIKAGVPVVPVALSGTREILPMGSGDIRPGPVRVRIGDPIETRQMTGRDREALTRAMRQRVVELLGGAAPAAQPVA